MDTMPVTNVNSSSGSGVVLTPMPRARLVSLLPVPYISQLGEGADKQGNDCGAACGLMLLKAYIPHLKFTVDEFYKMCKPEKPNALLGAGQILRALDDQGLRTTWSIGLNIGNILETLKEGKPLMVLINYGILSQAGVTENKIFKGPHFAVVIGIDNQFIYTNDPLYHENNGEAVAYPIDLMLEAWRRCAEQDNPNNGALIPNQSLRAIHQISAVPEALFRIRVTFKKGINIRCGPGMNFLDVGDLDPGDEADVFEVRKLENGQEWGVIGVERWILLDLTEKI